MSERYAALLKEWQKLDEEARNADKALNARYDDFLAGRGPEPTEWERQQLQSLRQRARAQLQAALDYLAATTAKKPPSP